MEDGIPGLGMQELLLLGLCVAIPLGVVVAILVVMRLTRKKGSVRDELIDERD